jgi:uncharacterized protein (DUF2267 family)
MSETGLPAFDGTLQKTHIWLNELMATLGWEDRQKAYLGLRVVLHELRDRLPVDEAVHLGAQLPTLVRGFYYEGWKPAHKPIKSRHKADFLAHVAEHFRDDQKVDAEELTRAVFWVLHRHVSGGEVADVKHILPPQLTDLWP